MTQLVPLVNRTSGIRISISSIVSNGRNKARNEMITDSSPIAMKTALIQIGIRVSAPIVIPLSLESLRSIIRNSRTMQRLGQCFQACFVEQVDLDHVSRLGSSAC